MAYVRTRTTGAGLASTALVEAYRDGKGRPRQRMLANLHGEPDVLRALAKLAAKREALRKEKALLVSKARDAHKFQEIVAQRTVHGHRYSDHEWEEIDRQKRQLERLVRRLTKIETDLETIQKDGAVIKKHCAATPDEVQAAIRAYKQSYHDAKAQVAGIELMWRGPLKEAKAKLRRLSS